MNLEDYFSKTEGTGVLATSGANGRVDAAIYGTPHIMAEGQIGFIMRPRRSLANIRLNPKAVFMYIEKDAGYTGKRIYLEKSGEETDQKTVNLLRRSHHGGDEDKAVLVLFKVTEIRPLVGDEVVAAPAHGEI